MLGIDLPIWKLIIITVLGLVAGVLGGMLGVGGSVIMIPGLAFVFSREPGAGQHLFQASAMIVNVVVSVPATLRHKKAGAIRIDALKWILPAALVCIVVGVWFSNLPIFEGEHNEIRLKRLLALFLVYVMFLNIMKLRKPKPIETPPTPTPGAPPATTTTHEEADASTVTPVRGGAVGVAMGFVAGLLGIGGGAVSVPLQQLLLRLPLRSCIANSSAIICLTAGVGALYKNLTLEQHGYEWQVSLLIAALLGPSAFIGGRLGANLTHRLPVRQVRIAFIALMFIAACKMASIPLPIAGT